MFIQIIALVQGKLDNSATLFQVSSISNQGYVVISPLGLPFPILVPLLSISTKHQDNLEKKI